MKKRAILIVGLALLMATAGVVYAHWTDTLTVDAQIITGNVSVDWIGIFTDDDGGQSPNVIGEELDIPAPLWPIPADGGSRDPSSFAVVSPTNGMVLITPAARWDKDVAQCSSGISSGSGLYPNNLPVGTMWVNIGNVYPSYHCTIWSTFTNNGTVPVKVQSVNTSIDTPMTLGLDAYWDTVVGTGCGLQIDPGETYTTVNYFHLLQRPDDLTTPGNEGNFNQNMTASVTQSINFVNWNEWDSTLCGTLPLHS